MKTKGRLDKGAILDSLDSFLPRLDGLGIDDYRIIGGAAAVLFGFDEYTSDIDILIFREFKKKAEANIL